MSLPRSDLDSPWKEILRSYLPQGIAFFFPKTSTLIDWTKSVEFLDKEFQQIAPKSDIGRRYADQLIKVWLQEGTELWLLLHLEVQSQREVNFEERMFTYSLRIFDRFHQIPVSLAILCDDSPTWRPTHYRVEYPDTVHEFQFGMVKLLDFRQDISALDSIDNPFATVVQAHLATMQTKSNDRQRKDSKLSLVRKLYDKGYGKKDILNIYRFIDWVMALPDDLEQEYWNELSAFEESQKMAYVTTGERIGYKRGGCAILLRQFQRKFGELPTNLESQIQSLKIENIEQLSESIFDFESLADLEAWLSDHGSALQA